MNKDSVKYFMTEMSQKEFEERNKDKIKCTYEFNRIQPERSKREDHESGCGALNSMET